MSWGRDAARLLRAALLSVIVLETSSHTYGQEPPPGLQDHESASATHDMQQAQNSQSKQDDRSQPDMDMRHGKQHEHGMQRDKAAPHEHGMQHSQDEHSSGSSAKAAEPPATDDTSSEAEHVPPEPAQHPMPAMPYRAMSEMMQMDDTERVGQVLLDQFEWRGGNSDNTAAAWEAQGWYRGDYNKLWVKSEGERVAGATQDARVDLLWNRIISRWWSVQAGGREDFASGPPRTWAALGVEGLAPYWFDVEATVYVGEAGRTAARLKTEYDLLLTQRLILQPEVEAQLYGKADPARRVGSGMSDLDVGLRLRYEIRREFAPYIGVAWRRLFGGTATQARAAGESTSDVQVVAGLRVWF